MNRFIAIATVLFMAAGLTFSACKKNSTIGAVGYPMDGDFPVFDTFNVPEAKYYFYGLFDGDYMVWADSARSKWDTATRFCIDPEAAWTSCPKYNLNVYFNFTEEGTARDTCALDTFSELYYHRTRFLRPEFADERIDIYMYDCVNFLDATNPNFPLNGLSVLNVGAYPFSNVEYGRNGAEVVYTDAFRDEWRTRPGSGNTLDTYFRLTSLDIKPVADTSDSFAVLIGEGEFAGRLFREDGMEKIVKDAKFRVRLVPRPVVP